MHHISIIKEGEDPLQVIALNTCNGCDAGCNITTLRYHCPICPPPKFKPQTSVEMINKHLKDHFNFIDEFKKACIRGYMITMCYQSCLLAKEGKPGHGHYHCPFCPYIVAHKPKIVKHASTCKEPLLSSSTHDKSGEVEKSRHEHKQTTDTSIVGGTQDQQSKSIQSSKEIERLNESIKTMELSQSQGSISKRRNKEEVRGALSFIQERMMPNDSSQFETEVDGVAEKKDAHSVILAYKRHGDSSQFEKVFKNISDDGNTQMKLSWIAYMTEHASLLDRKVDKLVLAFLKIPLFTSQKLADSTNNFIRTLIGHHNYYAYYILKQLFRHLIPVIQEGDYEESLVSAGYLSEEEEATYDRVLSAIIVINSDIPMTQDNLLILARKSMPYFQSHVHKHAVYARNLLLLASHLPHLRVAVLEVIIANMITIDVHAPRSELAEEVLDEEEMDSSDEDDMFDMELDDTGRKETDTTMKKSTEDIPLDTCQLPRAMTHKVGNTLDVLMSIMLQYVHDISHDVQKPRIPEHLYRTVEVNTRQEQCDECRPGNLCAMDFDPKRMGGCECGGVKQGVESLKHLYNDLKGIFSNIILRTHASAHVQFLLFYIISIRPGLLAFFADFLINRKFKDPNSSQCIRRNAMAYIGSLLARGKHITIVDVHTCLESIRDWCNEYLDTQERIPERNYEDIMLHGTFYYACQTLLYVFTFRYKQYTENKKTLNMARSLNLERFIHSKLNPLHICAPPLVNNFAAVAQRFQIAYCYTIIENNKRLGIPSTNFEDYIEPVKTLDSFFPFDPYLLCRSKLYIQNHYREFDGLPEDLVSSDAGMDVDDETFKPVISPESFDSMYGISPGFVRFSEESVYN